MTDAIPKDVIDLGLRAWRWLYGRHFRISRPLYALIAVVGVAVTILSAGESYGPGVAVGVAGIMLGVQGLIRWSWLSHPPAVLAVAVFACTDKGRALEVQRTIMTTLRDHLGRSFPFRLLSLPEVVAASESDHAAVLRRRLHALYLLFGDIRIGPGGDIAVFARVMQPSRGTITHVDEFTHEMIPQRTLWQEVLYRLTGGRADVELEYPFAFASELTSLIRSLEGKAYSSSLSRNVPSRNSPRRCGRSRAARATRSTISGWISRTRSSSRNAALRQRRY